MSVDKLDSTGEIFDDRICQLGESPVWHPLRNELFWVDLPENRVLGRGRDGHRTWDFDEMVSALAWVDESRLLLATETGLTLLDLGDGAQTPLCAIQPERPDNRTNDGRADPWGGFWISTMSKEAEADQGSIYRWYRGELRQLVEGLTIPNGICFDRQRGRAYHADSGRKLVYVQALDPQSGWPTGEREVFLDLSGATGEPDGGVTDAEGCLWFAIWDAACVARYAPDGSLLGKLDVGTPRPTCPAFGGASFEDLYVTTAAIGLEDATAAEPHGTTLVFSGAVKGQAEPQVIIENS